MTELTLFLCGDVMLGRGVDQIMPSPSSPQLFEPHVSSAMTYLRLAEKVHGPIPREVVPDYVWGDALAVLTEQAPAARIVNLETAITTGDHHWPKGINYRMHPDNVACLTAANIDCCVLANNHVLDWGREGLLDTLDALHSAGVGTAGAGRDASEAAAPAVVHVGGGTQVLVFGLASASSGVPKDWAARAAVAGVNLLPDLSEETAHTLAKSAQVLRQKRDLLIASIHWGENWGYGLPPEQRRFAHALIDGGFDLVHGHSSHHPKGVEIYRHKLVVYGCGDFINDYEGISGHEAYRGDLAVMYLPCVNVETGCLRCLRMIPMQIRQFRLNRPSPHDAAWLCRTLANESAALGARFDIQEDGSFEIREGGTSACI
ncbi:MAG TPA: CapA family protein [Acetobacteraceae bacterium]|nr:CapA family protein [Acetobacteraceae bacterium]